MDATHWIKTVGLVKVMMEYGLDMDKDSRGPDFLEAARRIAADVKAKQGIELTDVADLGSELGIAAKDFKERK